jgi:hypothetical protein
MKKVIIITLLFISTGTLFGQFTYGPRFGLGVATIENADAGFGMHLGVFINAELFDRFGVQPEVLFNIQTGSAEVGTDDVKYNHQTIDVPILIFFPLSKHLRVLVGPMLSNITSSKREVDGTKDNTYAPEASSGFAAGLETDAFSKLRFGARYRNAGTSTIEVTASYTFDW